MNTLIAFFSEFRAAYWLFDATDLFRGLPLAKFELALRTALREARRVKRAKRPTSAK
jgi:hypothetical protein